MKKQMVSFLLALSVTALSCMFCGNAPSAGVSPFDGCGGVPVYVTHNVYLSFEGGGFVDLETEETLPAAQVASPAETGFSYMAGEDEESYQETGFNPVYSTETINYSHKTTEEYDIPGELPDYQSYTTFLGHIFYKSQSEAVVDCMASLYELMGTDEVQLGTTYFCSSTNCAKRERAQCRIGRICAALSIAEGCSGQFRPRFAKRRL